MLAVSSFDVQSDSACRKLFGQTKIMIAGGAKHPLGVVAHQTDTLKYGNYRPGQVGQESRRGSAVDIHETGLASPGGKDEFPSLARTWSHWRRVWTKSGRDPPPHFRRYSWPPPPAGCRKTSPSIAQPRVQPGEGGRDFPDLEASRQANFGVAAIGAVNEAPPVIKRRGADEASAGPKTPAQHEGERSEP